jgi:deoxycytidylate deaminase
MYTEQDIQFMKEACWQCDLSNCMTKSGVIAVRFGVLVAQSHNQLPDNMLLTPDNERKAAIHAEQNLIQNYSGDMSGCVIYCTRFPCENCARLINTAGIKKVFYMSNLFTSGNLAQCFFDEQGIVVIQIPESVVWAKK